jgi:hypothetical protein
VGFSVLPRFPERWGTAVRSNENLFAFESTVRGPLAVMDREITVFFVLLLLFFLASNIRKSQKKEFI